MPLYDANQSVSFDDFCTTGECHLASDSGIV